MKISCPSCEAKYSIGDDKVQSRLAKIRCRKCGVDIVIDGRVQPPTVSVGETTAAAPEAMQQAAAASTTNYTIDFGENDQRTMTLDEVVASYNAGYVTPETYIWADGMSDWTPLGQIPEIVDALNAAASAPAPSATTSRTPSPAAAHVATHTAAAKTATRTAQRGGADLFGSISRAGGEEDMARQAAAAEPAAPQPTTGARNESSVLFSLSALTSSAKSAPGPQTMGVSSTASRDDSGLIDLKALTAQASETSASAAASANVGVGGLGAAPLGGLAAPLGGLGAPLGGAAPVQAGLGAPALADISYPQQKNRMGLYIGGGIAVGAIALALVFALKPDPPPPPKVEPQKIIEYKTREPEPIKETVATPPPTGEPTAAASATPAKPAAPAAAGKWRPKAKTGASSSGEKESGGSAAPAPAAPKPAANKCGCAAGDLACNMRCAAKGG